MVWEDVRYEHVDIVWPAIDRFLDAVRQTHVNGGAVLACFVASDPQAFDQAAHRDIQGLDHLFLTFLNADSVKAAVPELQIGDISADLLRLRYTVALGMEGELTHLLLTGGAYRKFEGSEEEARTLSRDFVSAMVNGRHLSASVMSSDAPWTEWFYDVAWDTTYVIYDPQVRRFWLLCITDTD